MPNNVATSLPIPANPVRSEAGLKPDTSSEAFGQVLQSARHELTQEGSADSSKGRVKSANFSPEQEKADAATSNKTAGAKVSGKGQRTEENGQSSEVKEPVTKSKVAEESKLVAESGKLSTKAGSDKSLSELVDKQSQGLSKYALKNNADHVAVKATGSQQTDIAAKEAVLAASDLKEPSGSDDIADDMPVKTMLDHPAGVERGLVDSHKVNADIKNVKQSSELSAQQKHGSDDIADDMPVKTMTGHPVEVDSGLVDSLEVKADKKSVKQSSELSMQQKHGSEKRLDVTFADEASLDQTEQSLKEVAVDKIAIDPATDTLHTEASDVSELYEGEVSLSAAQSQSLETASEVEPSRLKASRFNQEINQEIKQAANSQQSNEVPYQSYQVSPGAEHQQQPVASEPLDLLAKLDAANSVNTKLVDGAPASRPDGKQTAGQQSDTSVQGSTLSDKALLSAVSTVSETEENEPDTGESGTREHSDTNKHQRSAGVAVSPGDIKGMMGKTPYIAAQPEGEGESSIESGQLSKAQSNESGELLRQAAATGASASGIDATGQRHSGGAPLTAAGTSAVESHGATHHSAANHQASVSEPSQPQVQAQPRVLGQLAMGSPQLPSELNERINMMVSQKMQVAEIRLDPAELGHMQIRLQVSGDQASVQIQAQNPHAREALEQSMPRLKEMLAQQGIELGQSQINQGNGGEQHLGAGHQEGSGFGESFDDDEFVDDLAPHHFSGFTTADGIDYYA